MGAMIRGKGIMAQTILGATTAPPPPGVACGLFGAGAIVLALLLPGAAAAQASSGQTQRKTMEFGVVPSASRAAPQASEGAVSTPDSAGAQSLPGAQGAPSTAADATAPGGAAQATATQAPSGSAATASSVMPSVQAGLLECRGDMATAYGFGSNRQVRCEFRPSVGMVQYYVGTLERVGLDIGISDQGSMLWGVLATARDLRPGALAGRYVGVTSGFALGPGFSANMLASEDATRQITLQPVSVSADSGLSLSIAGAALTLEPSATRPR